MIVDRHYGTVRILHRSRALAITAAQQSRHFADYKELRFWVMEMGRERVRCWVATWADSPTDAWQLSHDIRTNLILGFRCLDIHAHQ